MVGVILDGGIDLLAERFIGTRYKVDAIHATGLIALRSNTKTQKEKVQ